MSCTAAASSKGGRGKPKASKSVSRSSKTGLHFAVGRIARFLKAGKYAELVSAGAPVYLSVVLEYLAAEGMQPGTTRRIGLCLGTYNWLSKTTRTCANFWGV